MKHELTNEVEIVEIFDTDIQEITGFVRIRSQSGILNCFVTDFKDLGPFYPGERCRALLRLLTYHYQKIPEGADMMKQIQGKELKYKLSGNILEISSDNIPSFNYLNTGEIEVHIEEKRYGAIDCGLCVIVEIQKDSDLKVGDFIEAEGRLDIQKAREWVRIQGTELNLVCDTGNYSTKCPIKNSEKYGAVIGFVGGMMKTPKKMKDITWLGSSPLCIIHGEIIEFIPFQDIDKSCYGTDQFPYMRHVALDCGVCSIIAEIGKESDNATNDPSRLKIGDFVTGSGYLEIRRIAR